MREGSGIEPVILHDFRNGRDKNAVMGAIPHMRGPNVGYTMRADGGELPFVLLYATLTIE